MLVGAGNFCVGDGNLSPCSYHLVSKCFYKKTMQDAFFLVYVNFRVHVLCVWFSLCKLGA